MKGANYAKTRRELYNNEDDLFDLEFSEFMNVFEEEWKRKILEDDWDDFYEKGEE